MKSLQKTAGLCTMLCLLATGTILFAQDAPVAKPAAKEKKKAVINAIISSVDTVGNIAVVTDKAGTSYTVILTEKTTLKKDTEKCTLDKIVAGDKVRVFAKKNTDGTFTATAFLCGSLTKKKEPKKKE